MDEKWSTDERREFDLACRVERERIKSELVEAEKLRLSKIVQMNAFVQWHKARDAYEKTPKMTPEQKRNQIVKDEEHKRIMLQYAEASRKKVEIKKSPMRVEDLPAAWKPKKNVSNGIKI